MSDIPNQDTTWIKVQQKTFTRWCNTFLTQRNLEVKDLRTDLKDGLLLINLLEVISDQTIKHNKKPRMNVQMLENLTFALAFLSQQGIQLVSIDSAVIFDGNLKLILGLIWTIILRYQLQIEQSRSAKQDLLDWIRSKIPEYNINNFTRDWQSGKALCALAEAVLPGQMNLPADFTNNPLRDAQLGMFKAKENMNIPMILDPEDMVQNPEELSMMTYLSYFRDFLDEESRRRDQELLERTPYPPNCRAYGRGLEPGNEAGNETDFTIEAINRFGRRCPTGGAPWEIGVNGPNSLVPHDVIDNGNGTYQVRYTPRDDGNHLINVGFQGQPIKGSPFNVNILASKADPVQSKCYGPGLEGGEAHKPAHFTIEAHNKAGVRLVRGGHPFAVRVLNPYGEPSPVDMLDNNDGTYSVTYHPTDFGEHVVEVTLNKAHVDKSAYRVPIDENQDLASPSRSYAEGPGLEPGNKNTKPAEFTIYAVAPNGTPKKTGGDLFDVHVEDPNGSLIQPDIKDNKDGTYTVKYQPTIPGNYNVDVVLRNKSKPLFYDHVKNSPVQVAIQPGTDASKCTAHGPGIEPGLKDTDNAEFFIQARDSLGNPVKEGGDNFNVAIKGPHGPVEAQVEDLGDGRYKVQYKPKEPGPHVINVDLEGTLIKDAPFHVDIKAGGWAKNTTIEDLKFLVRIRDRHNKPMQIGGEQVDVKITGPKGNVPVQVQDFNNGTYQASYNLQGPGQYTIPVTLKTIEVRNSPLTQTLS